MSGPSTTEVGVLTSVYGLSIHISTIFLDIIERTRGLRRSVFIESELDVHSLISTIR